MFFRKDDEESISHASDILLVEVSHHDAVESRTSSSYLPAMENLKAKLFTTAVTITGIVWLATLIVRNIEIGGLLEFGTVEFKGNLDAATERTAYTNLAQCSIVGSAAYVLTILSAIGFITTTRRTMKEDGWLLMSVILLFVFIPVELYCFWLDWKLIGLQYWGTWPLEEFRKAFMSRLTALAGLPFIAQLCYYTIPILIIFKPLQNKTTV